MAFFGRRDADHAGAAVLQGLPHGADDGRLRTAAADPTVHLAIGGDDGLVADVRRCRRQGLDHADQRAGCAGLLHPARCFEDGVCIAHVEFLGCLFGCVDADGLCRQRR